MTEARRADAKSTPEAEWKVDPRYVREGPIAVVVTYNSERVISECLTSLAGLEAVVVDNASSDRTVDIVSSEFPKVELLTMPINLGLSTALEIARTRSRGRDIIMLNPDTVASVEAILGMHLTLHAHPTGALGPALIYPDGSRQKSVFRFPTLLTHLAKRTPLGRTRLGERVIQYYECPDADDIDWLLGAAILFNGEALNSIGGFNPRYFLYCEDIDVCNRLKSAGWAIRQDSSAVVTHVYQRASRRTLNLRSKATRAHFISIVRLAASFPHQYFDVREMSRSLKKPSARS